MTQSAICLIFLIQKSLGEIIGLHVVSGFIGDNQKAIGITVIFRATPDMFPEPVPLDKEVLGPVVDPVSDCQLKSSLVVLKHAATKSSKMRGRDIKGLSDLKEQMVNGEKGTKTHAQCSVLSFSGRQGDLRM